MRTVMCDSFASLISKFHVENYATPGPNPTWLNITLYSVAPEFEDNDTFLSSSLTTPSVPGDVWSTTPRDAAYLGGPNPYWVIAKDKFGNNASFFASYAVNSIGANNDWAIQLVPSVGELGWKVTSSYGPVVAMSISMITLSLTTTAGVDTAYALMSHVRLDEPLLIQGSPENPCFIHGDLSAGNNNTIYGYKYRSSGLPLPPSPKLAPITFSIPSLEWESARSAHVWMKPQRANMVANPSFESTKVRQLGSTPGSSPFCFGWRSNVVISSVTTDGAGSPTGLGPTPRNRYCKMVNSTSRLVLESNLFPPIDTGDALRSVEASVSGTGKARIGIVSLDRSLQNASYEPSPWVDVVPGSFKALKALISIPDQIGGCMFRLEYEGSTDCYVDNVMVDINAAQLGYFDGNWHTGQQGDFSWYGGPTKANESFSIYYNDRKFNEKWMFGFTEEIAKLGRVSSLTYNTLPPSGVPPLRIEQSTEIRVARDQLISAGLTDFTVMDGSTPKGVLSLSALTQTVRVPGEAEKWVPERAQVIPQWDDVYEFLLPADTGDLFVPVVDYYTVNNVTVPAEITF